MGDRVPINPCNFNADAHAECNAEGKDIVLRYLREQGIRAEDNTQQNRYAVDFIIEDGFGDVEVRSVWSGAKYPFRTIHVPYRKKKYVELGKFLYFVINKQRTHMLICNGESIKNSKVVIIDTTRSHDESFYDVPIEEFKLENI